MVAIKTEEGRDPARTRRAILDATKELIAQEGSEAVSVSGVARLAGVNRGTAYLHFGDREELLRATMQSVGEELSEAISTATSNLAAWQTDDDSIMEAISLALHDNVQLSRIWLSEMLFGDGVQKDELWNAWLGGVRALYESDNVTDDFDDEVLAVIGLAASFMWPIITKAEKMSKAKREKSARRFAHAFDQVVLQGILKRE